MNTGKKTLLILITILCCVGCDQVSKNSAHEHLQGQPSIGYLGGLFNLTYTENTGAMLSLGANLPETTRFVLLVAVVGTFLVAALIYVLLATMDKLAVFALSLIIGGGFGNLWDRLANDGSVIDFMLIKLGPLQTGVFNVADMAVLSGCALYYFAGWRAEKNLKPFID